MPCSTCKRREPHRWLTTAEKQVLREATGRKYVDDFLVCVAPDCGNLRTGFNQNPFDKPRKLPEPR
ncbi:hypothetical protein J0695_27540 [Streptomyces beijiangensis]|uniref:Uncharacterized protein n=1 Tax=Streptomyces beijiangensis TaxID=163361 RepID=A0A939FC10_9ACTN|nr:hypothetical protein [Streptomyces beijiangensis]